MNEVSPTTVIKLEAPLLTINGYLPDVVSQVFYIQRVSAYDLKEKILYDSFKLRLSVGGDLCWAVRYFTYFKGKVTKESISVFK